MSSFFVTSSGTDIGKTYLCASLATMLREKNINYQIVKPIISGFDVENAHISDSGILLEAMGKDITAENLDALSPWRFKAPLSPHMAAAREHKEIALDDIVQFCTGLPTRELTLIEGVGGVMVPLNHEHLVIDWMEAMATPAIMVVGSYLGSISHSLTALALLHQRGVKVAAIIVSESEGSEVDLGETVDSIKQFNPSPAPILSLPRGGNHATISTLIDIMAEHA